MVSAKITKFFDLYLLGKIRQKEVLCNVLDRKLDFLDYKTSVLKSRIIGIFPKGVSPWFGPKF